MQQSLTSSFQVTGNSHIQKYEYSCQGLPRSNAASFTWLQYHTWCINRI